jgi:hypothetical protein
VRAARPCLPPCPGPGRTARMDKATYRLARSVVFRHYGVVCCCCGSMENLSIDAVAGGGGWHHRMGAGTFYRWLTRRGFPVGFQAMCMTCNRSKGRGPRCRLHHAEGVS